MLIVLKKCDVLLKKLLWIRVLLSILLWKWMKRFDFCISSLIKLAFAWIRCCNSRVKILKKWRSVLVINFVFLMWIVMVRLLCRSCYVCVMFLVLIKLMNAMKLSWWIFLVVLLRTMELLLWKIWESLLVILFLLNIWKMFKWMMMWILRWFWVWVLCFWMFSRRVLI